MRVNLDEVFEAFVAGVEERGPSVRDLQRRLGLSSSSLASKRLRDLEAAGLIEREHKHGPRGGAMNYPYRLTAKGRALATPLPVEAVQ